MEAEKQVRNLDTYRYTVYKISENRQFRFHSVESFYWVAVIIVCYVCFRWPTSVPLICCVPVWSSSIHFGQDIERRPCLSSEPGRVVTSLLLRFQSLQKKYSWSLGCVVRWRLVFLFSINLIQILIMPHNYRKPDIYEN